MSGLLHKLLKFKPVSESELNRLFEELAESFLYGGYVSVKDYGGRERYRIFIRTVEFYCHSEEGGLNLPTDPIVYHRNGRYVEGDVPYFPVMSFHAHASGYDITFEDECLKLRSSALIRAYEVYDVTRKAFLAYDRNRKIFAECNTIRGRVNRQSTYLYNFLNGFAGESVAWVDECRPKRADFKIAPRQNVYLYDGETKRADADKRPWSFTRMEDL